MNRLNKVCGLRNVTINTIFHVFYLNFFVVSDLLASTVFFPQTLPEVKNYQSFIVTQTTNLMLVLALFFFLYGHT